MYGIGGCGVSGVYGLGIGAGMGLVWCDDIGRDVYIKNFASATFVVEAIYVAATYSPTCAVPSA